MLDSRETETALLDNLGCEEGYLKYESTTSGAVTSVETYDSGTLSRFLEVAGKLTSIAKLSVNASVPTSKQMELITGMTSLQELCVTREDLSGWFDLPAGIERLKNLKTLKIEGLRGGLEQVAKLSGLLHLELTQYEYTQGFPSTLSNLTKLKTLNLLRCGLKSVPEVVFALKSLTSLNLQGNLIASLPKVMADLMMLNTLSLAKCRFSEVPPVLPQLPWLKDLNMRSNRLSDSSIPAVFADMKNLEVINIAGHSFTSGLHFLAGLPKLRKVTVSEAGISLPLYSTENGGYFFERDAVGYLSNFSHEHMYDARTFRPVNFAKWSPTDLSEGSASDGISYQVAEFCMFQCPQLLLKYPAKMFLGYDVPIVLIRPAIVPLFLFIRKLCEAQNPCVLHCLVRLWYALDVVAKRLPEEEHELQPFQAQVEHVTSELLKADNLASMTSLMQLFLPKKYCMRHGYRVADVILNLMHVYTEDGPMKLCIDHEVKFLLASPAVAGNIVTLLFHRQIDADPLANRDYMDGFRAQLEFETFRTTDDTYYRMLARPRYTPMVMFLVEGLGKAVMLVLVSYVGIVVYGKQGHGAFANTTAEGVLLLFLFTQLAYELGQLGTADWSVERYLNDAWNGLDVLSLGLVAGWALACCFPHHFHVARSLLSLSAIPLSLQMLQYISLIKSIGLLVLMIKAMIVDVMTFVLVYVVSIFGFGVCFYGLFFDEASFDSSGATLLYLFQSTLGNFDFGALNGSYGGVGTVVLVLFLVLTTILLINLLIAQMSSTYSRISERSRDEYAYLMATYVQERVLLLERTPLCMLPAPFNAITILLMPVHYWAMKQFGVSVAGTAADVILEVLVVPLRCFASFELQSCTTSLALVWSLLQGLAFSPLVMPYFAFSSVARGFYLPVRVLRVEVTSKTEENSPGFLPAWCGGWGNVQYRIHYFSSQKVERRSPKKPALLDTLFPPEPSISSSLGHGEGLEMSTKGAEARVGDGATVSAMHEGSDKHGGGDEKLESEEEEQDGRLVPMEPFAPAAIRKIFAFLDRELVNAVDTSKCTAAAAEQQHQHQQQQVEKLQQLQKQLSEQQVQLAELMALVKELAQK